MRILMVCLGNICRSPLAEGIMRSKIEQEGLDWEVDSAGTSAYHAGDLPDPRSIQVALSNGIDLRNQRSRQFRQEDFQRYDFVYVMDKRNFSNIEALASCPGDLEKIVIIMDNLFVGKGIEVPDPYWDDDGFSMVYDMLDKACNAIVKKHKNKEILKSEL